MGANHTITYTAQYRTGGAWVNFPGLLRVRTRVESADGGGGPFRFGGSVLPFAEIECGPGAPAAGWYRAPFRASIQVTVDGVAFPAEEVFTGLLTRRRPGPWGVTFEAAGAEGWVRKARVRTPLREWRQLATQTTLTSVENPAAAGYPGGLLNEIFWKAGGRPDAQRGSYPTARFFYACDGTSAAPEYSWIDGDNAWEQALRFAEAAGGQIYQDSRGILRYVNPLLLAESSPSPLIVRDQGPHGSGVILYDGQVEVEEDLEAAYNAAVCRFQRRAIQPPQDVYSAADHFDIEPSGSRPRDLATTWPVRWRNEAGAVDYRITVVACYDDGTPVTPTVTVTEESAMALAVSIANPSSSRPIHISKITVVGRPVTVLEEGIARYVGPRFDANADEDVEIRLNDSEYTQREGAAMRRARMAVVFDGTPRPVYRVRGAFYLPGVTVGQYALFSAARLSLVNVPCRIVDQELEDNGKTMSLALASVAGLPRLSERFVIGQTYADGDIRRVGL
ncbi:MAG TPA: hypothetical protein PKD53_04720 [Chloroflexaceae bacterium]|nr:hypothetical protein [Chloroflexaceae bacterium]